MTSRPRAGGPSAPGGPIEPEHLRSWARVADTLSWARPWADLYVPAEGSDLQGRWFVGGRLNLSVNCVDRHLSARGDRAALLWEGEPGDRRALTYRELYDEVCGLARALSGLGVGAGDRVALHLGWLPETVAAMLACARLGAVTTLLPTPLPVEALAERLEDFGPKMMFTQDGAWRHGAILPLKSRADEALTAVGGVEHTVVVRRTGVDVVWFEGDRWLHDLVTRDSHEGPTTQPPPLPVEAEHPLTVVNLPSRRGRPLSVVHGTANLLAVASVLHAAGLSDGGIYWCAGDISWLGAQVHGVYAPLCAGDTAVMFEGTLDVPTPQRAWEIVNRYDVSTLVTSPSVVRQLRGWSRRPPAASAVASLRRVVTLGESIEPALQAWVVDEVGRGRLTVGDAWGQVELGGIVSVDHPVQPGVIPDPGFDLLDEEGHSVTDGSVGELVMRRPWAGSLRGAEGAGTEDVDLHWTRHPGVYSTGDLARREPDGSLSFLGRLDEVANISGQLVSLSAVREVLLGHPFVAATEVVERVDGRLGRSLAAAVVLEQGMAASAPLARDLLDAVREVLGGLARPRALIFLDRLGDELPPSARRAALAILARSVREEPVHITWAQVLAAAESQSRGVNGSSPG